MTFAGARRPARTAHQGRLTRLEPLDAAAHADGLIAADRAGEQATWRWLPYGPWPDPESHRAWLVAQEGSTDPQFWTVLVDGRPLGVLSALAIEPAHGSIEIGHVWFSTALQRTPAATEAIFLLADAFLGQAGYRRLEWKTDAENAPSRRAAERLGFTAEGVFRQHRWIKGANRDTAWFALLDHEWPAARGALVAWLDPGNFDADGGQRRRLEQLRPPAADDRQG